MTVYDYIRNIGMIIFNEYFNDEKVEYIYNQLKNGLAIEDYIKYSVNNKNFQVLNYSYEEYIDILNKAILNNDANEHEIDDLKYEINSIKKNNEISDKDIKDLILEQFLESYIFKNKKIKLGL